MTILDEINSPTDLKDLSYPTLEQLVNEIREFLINTVALTGGHLASSLGVVELTIALHRTFNSPEDKIVWDVGHQSYTHKVLTGRKHSFDTLRQLNGISGFPVRTESPHDSFGTGHAGTSVSAALGMALARDLAKEKREVIAVIGDGSLGAGMALEAINHAGHLNTKLIVILNDNGMSISPSIGALSKLLNQVRFDPRLEAAKQEARKTITRLPFGETAWEISRRIKTQIEGAILPSAFWEQMGFNYLGPIDGHNIKDLESALAHARDFETGATLIHIITQKGKGHADAEANATKFHGVPPNHSRENKAPSYGQVFAQTVTRLMEENDKIIAITAAMLDGTGLSPVAARFPKRVIDVGICEQHAVTLAAGLSTQGYIPIIAIYSTFLQRAYDQIIHDVCLQKLPVVFAIDRAGIVGDDGKTHQGPFDISYLRSVPNMIISAPANEDEFQHLLYTAVNCGQPMAIRYPRGSGVGVPLKPHFEQLPIGKGEVLRDGEDLAILAIGVTVYPALTAAKKLAEEGIDCAVVNSRFAKPLDEELILALATKTKKVLTIEENTLAGGFGSAVLELLHNAGLPQINVDCLGLPDWFIEHGTQQHFRSKFDLDTNGIIRRIKTYFPKLPVRSSIKQRESVNR